MDILIAILYILGAGLLITLIILGIKLINTVNRINMLLDNVDEKMKKVDQLFLAFDKVINITSSISDKVVDVVATLISKIFKKKNKELEED